MPAGHADRHGDRETPLLKHKLSGPVYLSDIGTPAPDDEGVELPYVTVFLKAPASPSSSTASCG